IKERGGVAIVQDPDEAASSGMPLSAIRLTDVDYILPAYEIGPTLEELVMSPAEEKPHRAHRQGRPGKEPTPEKPERDALEAHSFHTPPSPLTCPECGGALWELKNGELIRYRCHVGHGFNEDSLLNGQKSQSRRSTLERAAGARGVARAS